MSSAHFTCRFSRTLVDVVALQCGRRGYSNKSAYVRALVRADLMGLVKHQPALELEGATPSVQDKVEAQMLEQLQRKLQSRGISVAQPSIKEVAA